MQTTYVVRRAIDFLRRPFIQRLIMLVVSTFLAMSLGYATLVIALPQSGREVAMSRLSQPAEVRCLDTVNRHNFTPDTRGSGLISVPGAAQRTGNQLPGRRHT